MKTLFRTICLSFLITPFIGMSQGGQKETTAFGNHAYNIHTVITIEGKITEVQQIDHERGKGKGTHIKVQTNTTLYTVLVGPAWYMDKQKFVLKDGDQIKVTGSKVDADLVIAEYVISDGKTLKLRDKAGNPEWAGKQK